MGDRPIKSKYVVCQTVGDSDPGWSVTEKEKKCYPKNNMIFDRCDSPKLWPHLPTMVSLLFKISLHILTSFHGFNTTLVFVIFRNKSQVDTSNSIN